MVNPLARSHFTFWHDAPVNHWCDIEGFALDRASCKSWKQVNPRAGPAADNAARL